MPEPRHTAKAEAEHVARWFRKADDDEKDERLTDMLVVCYPTKAAQDS